MLKFGMYSRDDRKISILHYPRFQAFREGDCGGVQVSDNCVAYSSNHQADVVWLCLLNEEGHKSYCVQGSCTYFRFSDSQRGDSGVDDGACGYCDVIYLDDVPWECTIARGDF